MKCTEPNLETTIITLIASVEGRGNFAYIGLHTIEKSSDDLLTEPFTLLVPIKYWNKIKTFTEENRPFYG